MSKWERKTERRTLTWLIVALSCASWGVSYLAFGYPGLTNLVAFIVIGVVFQITVIALLVSRYKHIERERYYESMVGKEEPK